jgi:murein DD-endopeptidase MepM/ murein hydrolase activator NlpD
MRIGRPMIAIALVVMVGLSIVSVRSGSARAADALTPEDVDAALAARRQAGAALEAMTARFEEAMADEEILRDRIGALARSVSDLERDIGQRRVAVLDLVTQRYMSGGSLGTERFFTARTFTDLPIQAEYLDLMNARDLAILRGLESAEALHVDQQALLDASLASQRDLVAELTTLSGDLASALAAADAEYLRIATAYEEQEAERRRIEEERRRAEEEEARRRAEEAAAAATSTTSTAPDPAATTTTTTTRATTTTSTPTSQDSTTSTTVTAPPPPPVTDGMTCPVDAATSFSDSWGAPRSGGRTHKGVDMVSARNAPIVAIESGTVTRTSNSSLGGLSIYLTGASGSRYYYAHLEYIADGITGGASVGVGDLLGGNGSSGNAPDWLPHLHFQYAPPGSDWIDPYPLAKELCG